MYSERSIGCWGTSLVLAVASGFALNSLAIADEQKWEFGLYLEVEAKERGDTTTSLKPRLAYDQGTVGTHLSYETEDPIDGPDNDALEWEVFIRLGDGLKLQNEYGYEIDTGMGESEVTAVQYFDLPAGFKAGYEIEVDYFEDNSFDLHRIEIEPTLKWSRELQVGELSAELEFPVLQIYDREDRANDFEIVSAQFGLEYAVEFNQNTQWEVEIEFPYDVVDREFETELTIGWERSF